MEAASVATHVFSLLPLGEGSGMRVCERNPFFYLCSGAASGIERQKISIGVEAPLNPHPNPLPAGEGEEFVNPRAR